MPREIPPWRFRLGVFVFALLALVLFIAADAPHPLLTTVLVSAIWSMLMFGRARVTGRM